MKQKRVEEQERTKLRAVVARAQRDTTDREEGIFFLFFSFTLGGGRGYDFIPGHRTRCGRGREEKRKEEQKKDERI